MPLHQPIHFYHLDFRDPKGVRLDTMIQNCIITVQHKTPRTVVVTRIGREFPLVVGVRMYGNHICDERQ